MDRLLKATAADGTIRIFGCESRELINEAIRLHGLKPTGAALLGRLLTAGAMMGSMLKNTDDLLTIQVKGTGPAMGALVTASGEGVVKGYLGDPDVDIERKENGKLNVSGAIGLPGNMTVIMDMGLKEPYVSSVPLQTGEIGEDLAYYYTVSEQLPSAVALGVLIGPDGKCLKAGGFIIQMMPGYLDETADLLQERVGALSSITSMLNDGMSIDSIINNLFTDLDLKINQVSEPLYRCDCSRSKVEKALISIGKKDLEEICEDGHDETLTCHFCNKKYVFTNEDIRKLVKEVNNF